MEEKSDRKSKEYIKEFDLYEKVKELTMQLHSANAQLKNANEQNHQWLQEKERLTKENEILQQKNTELTKQIQKQSETIKVITEEKKKTIEDYNKVNDLLASSKREVVQLNDKILLMETNQEFVLRTEREERYYRLFRKLRDIVYDEKYDDWVASSWRFMERTDFKDFLGKLRTALDEI